MGSLPADPRVSAAKFADVRALEEAVSRAAREFRRGRCAPGESILAEGARLTARIGEDSYAYVAALGDREACRGNLAAARPYWRRALALHPAYRAERDALAEKLRR
jgi:hypothetical protein